MHSNNSAPLLEIAYWYQITWNAMYQTFDFFYNTLKKGFLFTFHQFLSSNSKVEEDFGFFKEPYLHLLGWSSKGRVCMYMWVCTLVHISVSQFSLQILMRSRQLQLYNLPHLWISNQFTEVDKNEHTKLTSGERNDQEVKQYVHCHAVNQSKHCAPLKK